MPTDFMLEPSGPVPPRVVRRGLSPYLPIEAAMRAYAQARQPDAPDEIWLVEHEPVYTLGIAGRAEHVLDPGHIPVQRTERGGQVTYHGPGQVVAYPLVDLRRLGIYVKEYVYRLEQAAIQALDHWGVTGFRVPGAPGVYVRLADPTSGAQAGPQPNPFDGLGKIAAVGIKVRRHCAYHGLALNVAMDLRPFGAIDPCGYSGLRVVDLTTLGVHADVAAVADVLAERLVTHLSPSTQP